MSKIQKYKEETIAQNKKVKGYNGKYKHQQQDMEKYHGHIGKGPA